MLKSIYGIMALGLFLLSGCDDVSKKFKGIEHPVFRVLNNGLECAHSFRGGITCNWDKFNAK